MFATGNNKGSKVERFVPVRSGAFLNPLSPVFFVARCGRLARLARKKGPISGGLRAGNAVRPQSAAVRLPVGGT